MEKGKLGIRLSFYAVAAFILAFLGYSTVLALLAGFVLIVEKNEWASRQVIQAFFLFIFADIVNGILNIFDFLYQIPLMGSVWGTAISVIDGIVSLVVLIFCIMALAVSYTHLDVYKRQCYICTDIMTTTFYSICNNIIFSQLGKSFSPPACVKIFRFFWQIIV